MARFFVTGGAGFIGSYLVPRLLEKGEVTVYDNLSSGKKEFLTPCLKDIKFIKGDLLDKKKLLKSIKGHDMVYHLAANPDIRRGITETGFDLEQGTVATFNVLDSMRITGIKDICFSSSSVVYGEAKVIPTPEDYGPLLPISLYGASKLACEGLITGFCGTFGMRSWIYRFANIVGGNSTHGIIYDFMKKLGKDKKELEILGDGMQEKSYLHAGECVDGMLAGVGKARDSVNVFNLGCDDRIRITRIAEIVVEELGLKGVNFRYTGGRRGWPGDVPSMLLSTERMKSLGWRPKLSSEGAVRRAASELIGGK
ncbi:MAG: NAD-dependent epimerase/dehydratase family protein [Candidatus Altiarchaeota archaeon]|nr:NAD-dependent epimerase/dehydratase family protein [Candidatus Altiarchaeota archaeon]